jgi:hypothetical protein
MSKGPRGFTSFARGPRLHKPDYSPPAIVLSTMLPRVDLQGGCLLLFSGRNPRMIKLFQGDFQSVQNDVNNWIEVYKPKIVDFKQSLIVMEHTLIVLLTFHYEANSETQKVEYKIKPLKK